MTMTARLERGLTLHGGTKRGHALCGINYGAMNDYQLLAPPKQTMRDNCAAFSNAALRLTSVKMDASELLHY